MATEPVTIDLDDDAALARALAEVERTREPRQLRRDGRVIAVLNPPPKPRSARRERTEEEKEREFWATAGSWKDVDTDQLLEDIYAHRDMSMPRTFGDDDDDAPR